MRFAFFGLALMAVAGCGPRPRTPPEAYLKLEDRMRSLFVFEELGMLGPCQFEDVPSGQSEAIGHTPLRECYRFEPPRRWSGVWRNEFEGSEFCPGAARTCGPGNDYWLDMGWPKPFAYFEDDTRPVPYKIEFIGRRTAVPGSYGHMGAYKYLIVIDRVISAEPLPERAAQ